MPISEQTFKCGDIIVVPFPYTDRLAEKRRPALVLSGDKFNTRSGFLWVAMITSKTHKSLPDDFAIDHLKAGLSKPSLIRLAKLATIESDRVIRVVGRLDAKMVLAVRKALRAILD